MLTGFGGAGGRPRFRRLGAFELLEERHLMAGDLLADSGPPALVAAADAGTETAAAFERFSSAQELKDYLLQAALTQWQHLFGQRREHGLVVCYDTVAFSLAATVARVEADSFSGTNVQVAGVDEADLVKTDGDYLYLLRGRDLLILYARSAAEMQLVSHTRLTVDATDMYLHGDRLSVIARSYQNGTICTDVTVYDVSDRAQPVVHRQTLLEGRYVSSRQIDDRLVFVLENGFQLPRPEFIPDPDTPPPQVDSSGNDADAALEFSLFLPNRYGRPGHYETQEEYLARVEDQVLELALPGYRAFDEDAIESHGLLSAASEIYRPLSTSPPSLISVVILDASGEAEAPLSTASVPVAGSNQVYATAENLYVLGNRWDAAVQSTTIHKFHLSATGVDLVATGSVEGGILNQFSIDEHEGFLRIATTEGWRNNARNNVYVLGQDGNELNVVGSIEDLAPGERIFSVRFMGDSGFVVTFRHIDPLFALDLSDPEQPRLAGELHIPGFSNYLHPAGENHLIGIGRDADLTGRQQGLQVSLFDVSNLAEPQLIERFSIDAGQWASSAGTFDHHAVGYFSQTQTLAIPVQSGPVGWGWINGAWGQIAVPTSEMWVFHVDVSEGLSLEARIEMQGTARRSLQIDEALYLISTETVIANSLADPNVQLAAVDLPEGESHNVGEPPIVVRPLPITLPILIQPVEPEPLPPPDPDPEVTPPPPVSDVDVPEVVVEPEVPEIVVVESEPPKDPPTIEISDPQPTVGVVLATIDTEVVEVRDIVTVTSADAANVDALDGQNSRELTSYLAAGFNSVNGVPEMIDVNGGSAEIVAAPSSKRVLHVPVADSRGELLSPLPDDDTRRRQARLPPRVPGNIDPMILVDALFASDFWDDRCG